MSVRWITPQLGTAAFPDVEDAPDYALIDVRDLVDKAGNSRAIMAELIRKGMAFLEEGRKVVVGCGYGISRSNALAVGILSGHTGVSFAQALREVQDATGEKEIKLALLQAVQDAMPASRPKPPGSQDTIMVTGATGLVGRALMPRLERAYPVLAPGRDELDVAAGPTDIYRLAEAHGVGTIVHLAHPRIRATNAALGESLSMLRNVIEVCCASNRILVYPSSWEVYSGYAATLCADEATPLLPRGPYGETKYLAEELIRNAGKTQGLRWAILRAATLFDDGGSKPDFLIRFINKARHSAAIATHAFRNGAAALDLLHVDDFVTALLDVLRSGFAGTLNFGSGALIGTRQIAENIVGALDSASPITQTVMEDDMSLVAMNADLAAQQLNWKPEHPFFDRLPMILRSLNAQEESRLEYQR